MVVFHFHGRLYTLSWKDLILLVMLCASLAAFVLPKVVKWWHIRRERRSMLDARKPVGKRIELVLQVYTVKILRYYMDNKHLPSIAELQQMQREAIENTPEIWEYIFEARVRGSF